MINGPVVEPAVTVTLGGTVRLDKPLLLSITATPPLGSAFDSATVQLLLALVPSVVGLHCSDETVVDATRLMVAILELPL